MGFRSTVTVQDYPIQWPAWFIEKYDGLVRFNEDGRGVFASMCEAKSYSGLVDLHADVQKAIDWDAFSLDKFVMVYLHECGGITRCQIERDTIKWSEPDGWRRTEGVEHSYCYGCSDASQHGDE